MTLDPIAATTETIAEARRLMSLVGTSMAEVNLILTDIKAKKAYGLELRDSAVASNAMATERATLLMSAPTILTMRSIRAEVNKAYQDCNTADEVLSVISDECSYSLGLISDKLDHISADLISPLTALLSYISPTPPEVTEAYNTALSYSTHAGVDYDTAVSLVAYFGAYINSADDALSAAAATNSATGSAYDMAVAVIEATMSNFVDVATYNGNLNSDAISEADDLVDEMSNTWNGPVESRDAAIYAITSGNSAGATAEAEDALAVQVALNAKLVLLSSYHDVINDRLDQITQAADGFTALVQSSGKPEDYSAWTDIVENARITSQDALTHVTELENTAKDQVALAQLVTDQTVAYASMSVRDADQLAANRGKVIKALAVEDASALNHRFNAFDSTMTAFMALSDTINGSSIAESLCVDAGSAIVEMGIAVTKLEELISGVKAQGRLFNPDDLTVARRLAATIAQSASISEVNRRRIVDDIARIQQLIAEAKILYTELSDSRYYVQYHLNDVIVLRMELYTYLENVDAASVSFPSDAAITSAAASLADSWDFAFYYYDLASGGLTWASDLMTGSADPAIGVLDSFESYMAAQLRTTEGYVIDADRARQRAGELLTQIAEGVVTHINTFASSHARRAGKFGATQNPAPIPPPKKATGPELQKASEANIASETTVLDLMKQSVKNHVPGSAQQFVEANTRHHVSIATHDRSAFVFSDRAAYRVVKNTDGTFVATPPIARLTSPTPDAIAGLNRPYIQILKENEGEAVSVDGNGNPVYSSTGGIENKRIFDMFIVSSINVVDVEKMDVVETFGNPHFFSSGRFAKKLVVNGIIRSEPRVPALSNGVLKDKNGLTIAPFSTNAADTFSDFVMFRNFYDDYARSTKLAEVGGYIRFFVDGDYFDGYIQNLQFGRDSNIDSVLPWSMSMVLFRHWNVNDDKARGVLKGKFGDLKKKPVALSNRQAQAEVAGATGNTEIVAFNAKDLGNAGSTTSKSATAAVITLVEGSTKPQDTLEDRPYIRCKGSPTNLTAKPVDAKFNGIVAMVYASDVEKTVHGSPAPIDRSESVRLKVLDFSKLATLASSSLPGAGALSDLTAQAGTTSIAFTVSTQETNIVTITFRVKIDSKAALSVDVTNSEVTSNIAATSVRMSFSDTSANTAAPTVAKITRLKAEYPTETRPKVISSSGNVSLKVKLKLSSGANTPVSLKTLAGASVAIAGVNSIKPVQLSGSSTGREVVDSPDSKAKTAFQLSADLTPLQGADSFIYVSLTATVPSTNPWGTDPAVSPLTYADAMDMTVDISINLPGYSPLPVTLSIVSLLPKAAGFIGLFKGIAPVDPTLAPGPGDREEDGKPGWYLKVQFLFASGRALTKLPDAVVSAIKGGLLHMETTWMKGQFRLSGPVRDCGVVGSITPRVINKPMSVVSIDQILLSPRGVVVRIGLGALTKGSGLSYTDIAVASNQRIETLRAEVTEFGTIPDYQVKG